MSREKGLGNMLFPILDSNELIFAQNAYELQQYLERVSDSTSKIKKLNAVFLV